ARAARSVASAGALPGARHRRHHRGARAAAHRARRRPDARARPARARTDRDRGRARGLCPGAGGAGARTRRARRRARRCTARAPGPLGARRTMTAMKVLLVHPSPLMYSEIFLRLEPIGVERVAAAVRAAGHEVRLLDLQIFAHDEYHREVADFAPDAVGFSLNYL